MDFTDSERSRVACCCKHVDESLHSLEGKEFPSLAHSVTELLKSDSVEKVVISLK